MVATNLTLPPRGIEGTPHHEGFPSNDFIFMCDHTINFHIQAKNYDIIKSLNVASKETSSSHPSVPLQIEKPYFDAFLRPPEGRSLMYDT
jgi:hypothetical protein